MSRPSSKDPVVVSSRAAQRLAAIYRQHRPDQPALALVPQLGRALPVDNHISSSKRETRLQAAVLDVPWLYPCNAATPAQAKNTDWQRLRDTHSELYVTCNTLCRLQLLHGALVEVAVHLACSTSLSITELLKVPYPHDNACSNSGA